MLNSLARWLDRLLTSPSLADIYGSTPRSPRWSATRRKHLEQQQKCEACDRVTSLEVHHVMPYHLRPELELSPGNLMTLCEDCHFIFGHYSDWRSHNPLVRVDAAAWLDRVRSRPQG